MNIIQDDAYKEGKTLILEEDPNNVDFPEYANEQNK